MTHNCRTPIQCRWGSGGALSAGILHGDRMGEAEPEPASDVTLISATTSDDDSTWSHEKAKAGSYRYNSTSFLSSSIMSSIMRSENVDSSYLLYDRTAGVGSNRQSTLHTGACCLSPVPRSGCSALITVGAIIRQEHGELALAREVGARNGGCQVGYVQHLNSSTTGTIDIR